MFNPEIPKISLKAARVNANLTQTQAGQAIGVTPDTIGRYEMGKSPISYETAKKLCELYKYPMDYIIFLPEN